MALFPAGDHIKYASNTSAFDDFNRGDIILVKGTSTNNGVYTVKDVMNDGTHSYMTVSGGALNSEGGASTHSISSIGPYGDKLLAIGDVDNGEVDIWSYNAVTDSTATDNAWTAGAITPLVNGSDAKFVYYFANDALRVCDVNSSNTSQIKWFGFVDRIQFDNAYTGAVFNAYEESPNYLPAPTAGNYLTGSYYGGITQIASGATVNEAVDDSETVIDIDESSKVYPGLVLQLGTSTEYVMVRKVVSGTTTVEGSMTVYRGYGGTAITTHSASDVIYKMGLGFNIAVTEDTLDGLWPAKIWEFAQTFIYDGEQESKIFKMAATFNNSGGTDDKKLNVSIFGAKMYPSRITGGRIYIRESGSHDLWILLADIDLAKGARASLLTEYQVWASASTSNHMTQWNVPDLDSDEPNIDSYNSLNGFGAGVDEQSIALGKTNERFKAATIANSRCFLANVARETDSGANSFVDNFGDRIYYSEVFKYDTFPSSYTIDVSKGDAEEYTHLESYADRILAFKHNTLHIINIASETEDGWFLEKSLKFMGVSYPYNATKTDFGVAWANPQGCFLFDGSKIINLIDGKIKDNGDTFLETVNDTNTLLGTNVKIMTWDKFVRGSAQLSNVNVGYHPKDKLLIVQRSPSNSSDYSNSTYIYDFGAKAWTLNDNMFTDSGHYTNFQVDWNRDLFLGYKADGTVQFKKVINEQSAQDDKVFITKDIDFGQPGMKKKIYAVYMTYYANTAIDGGDSDIPLQYAVDGGFNWTSFSTSTVGGSHSTSQLQASGTGTGEHWDVVKFSLNPPISCQSIKLKMDANTSAKLNINDITIEFRMIRKMVG
jgi:hypothetical protein